MITLQDAIKAVREQNLTKTELEDYHAQMSELCSLMQLEMADLEKDEALYMSNRADGESAISRKISWKATQGGQRLIYLKRSASATKTMLGSIKNRLYLTY